MAPTLVRPPFHRDGWVYEEKYDGWRMLAYKDGVSGIEASRRCTSPEADVVSSVSPTFTFGA